MTLWVSRRKSSRGTPHDLPLSHHRACVSGTTAVSAKIKRGVMAGQADEAACIEPRDRHRLLGLFAGGQAPPAFARRGQPACLRLPYAVPGQEVDDGADALAALERDAAQLATDPAVEVAQRAL